MSTISKFAAKIFNLWNFREKKGNNRKWNQGDTDV